MKQLIILLLLIGNFVALTTKEASAVGALSAKRS